MRTRLGLTNRRRRSSELPGALAVVLIFLLLVFFGAWLLTPVRAIVFRVVSPITWASDKLFGGLSAGWRSRQSLASDNLRLGQRVLELEAMLADFRRLETDNALLREELALGEGDDSFQVVEVISRPWNVPFDVILVELSRPETVAVGQMVRFKQSTLVGEVVERSGAVAKVKLISAPGASVPVLIGEDNIPGVALGSGNGNLAVSLPRSLVVSPGDLAYAASSTEALVVGTVGAVEKDPAESLQTIFIRTPVNLSYLRYLEIYDR